MGGLSGAEPVIIRCHDSVVPQQQAPMKQSIFYYSAVVLVILGSVLFGLDWQSTTLSPMPPIQVVALPPSPLPPPPAPAKPATPVAAPPTVVAPTPVVPRAAKPSLVTPRIAAPSPSAPTAVAPAPVGPVNPPVAQTPPKPLCDVAACSAAYRSFRESDCTYNPSIGPRTLCTKGVVPGEPAATPVSPAAPTTSDGQPSIMQDEPNRQMTTQPATPPNTQSNTKCNVAACAAAYRTFTESDCTFLATGGLRKLCAR